MKKNVKCDPWLDKQPPPDFVDELRAPVHADAPIGFGRRAASHGEVNVTGLWIDNRFHDPKGLLVSVIEDFDRFVCLCRFEGESFSVRLEEGPTPCFEAYTIRVSKAGVVVTAADTEGIRRALIWMEDEMRRREGPYLPLGRIERRPFIRSRITRSIFAIINGMSLSGDVPQDDADYYPEEYLNRLMHDGINGMWLHTCTKDNRQEEAARMDRLRGIIEKCACYGIKVYVSGAEEDGVFVQCPELGGMIGMTCEGISCTEREQACGYGLWEVENGSGMITTVPYMPVPGILYKKYAAACQQGVTGVLQCGYPSLMSKAAGELAFEAAFDDEAGFLRRLAGICWGNSRADAAVKAWQLFEKGYRQCPADGLFADSGLLCEAPARKLWLRPDSDTEESLMQGYTPEEALVPVGRMCTYWNAGLRALDALEIVDEARQEQWSVAHTIGLLLESGRNVLEFYRLRELLVQGVKPEVTLDSMRIIAEAEIRSSRMLAVLSVQDGRLGYIPGEGYRFFPEKLADRVVQLEELLKTEYVQVRARIEAGEPLFV